MRARRLVVAATTALMAGSSMVGSVGAGSPKATTVVYDDFSAASGLGAYNAKWGNPYGLGDMGETCADGETRAHGDTRTFSGGTFHIMDAPFTCGADFSVFDHLKYIAISTQEFAVPDDGSLTFSSRITASTPGTQPGRVVHGTYGPPGSYPNGTPYAATVLEGQQAGAVMNMVNFQTGQLFDWFVSDNKAFALIERLPSAVTNPALDPSSPDWVGPDKMYTQIIKEVPITRGVPHTVSITYTRGTGMGTSVVEFFLDGTRVAKVKNVGIPLDKQAGETYTGYAPSFGPGEDLKDKLDSFVIGHGTFSLLDAFPYQWGWGFGPTGPTCDPAWPTVCAASVSIPLSERLFGQGVIADFDDFAVTTRN